MPLHRFRCARGHVSEILVPLEHNKWQPCETCTMMAYQIVSAPHFRMAGVIPVNDSSDDPWEGTPLEGKGEPNTLTYKSDKIFLDTGKRTSVGARSRPVDYAAAIANAEPPRRRHVQPKAGRKHTR